MIMSGWVENSPPPVGSWASERPGEGILEHLLTFGEPGGAGMTYRLGPVWRRWHLGWEHQSSCRVHGAYSVSDKHAIWKWILQLHSLAGSNHWPCLLSGFSLPDHAPIPGPSKQVPEESGPWQPLMPTAVCFSLNR